MVRDPRLDHRGGAYIALLVFGSRAKARRARHDNILAMFATSNSCAAGARTSAASFGDPL